MNSSSAAMHETASPVGGITIPLSYLPETCLPIMIGAIFGSLAWLAVGLRTYTRVVIVGKYGYDDLVMTIALLFFTVSTVAWIILNSIVEQKAELDLHDFFLSLQWTLVCECLYPITIVTIKISLSIFFLRIVTRMWQRYVIYAVLAVSTFMSTAYFFFTIFQCGTFSSITEFALNHLVANHCVHKTQVIGMGYAHAAITSAADIALTLLPVAVVYRIQTSRREKIVLCFILTLAAAGSFASIVRFRYIARLATPKKSFYSNTVTLAAWSCVELALGIVAASLSTLRPLFRKFFSCNKSTLPTSRRNLIISGPLDSSNRLRKSISTKSFGSTQKLKISAPIPENMSVLQSAERLYGSTTDDSSSIYEDWDKDGMRFAESTFARSNSVATITIPLPPRTSSLLPPRRWDYAQRRTAVIMPPPRRI